MRLMALLTPLSGPQAQLIADAHHLGRCLRVEPLEAGSVNSSFFFDTEKGSYFLRIYEEQKTDGVAYEWALLDHLRERGIPIAARIAGPPPGELCVDGKPTAVFERATGRALCAARLAPVHVRAVGEALGQVHRAVEDFGWRRDGRFGSAGLEARLERAERAQRPELEHDLRRLREALDHVRFVETADLPRGTCHGDLFKDNILFRDDAVEAILDWESTADGPFIWDWAVTFLAFCYHDDFRWDLGRALRAGYERERPISEDEWAALPRIGQAAAARFAITRITDFHLRPPGLGEMRDYRRFVARLDELARLDAGELRARLT